MRKRAVGWRMCSAHVIVAAIVFASPSRVAAQDRSSGGCAPSPKLALRDQPGGQLRIIPSAVPGVEIDSASWRAWARITGLGTTQEGIDYSVRLRPTRSMPSADVALLYENRRPEGVLALMVDHTLEGRLGGSVIENPVPDILPVAPDAAHLVVTSLATVAALMTGPRTRMWRQCPVAVRIIPRSDVALYLQPGVAIAASREALVQQLLASDSSSDTASVRVIASRNSDDWSPSERSMGAAVSRSDTILIDMVAALIVESSERYRLGSHRQSRLDTLEYFIPRVAPGAVVGFFGGIRWGDERVVERVSYPASRVRGRGIAGEEERHRVSDTPRIAAIVISPRVSLPFKLPVGSAVTLSAEAVDSAGRPIRTYASSPRSWTVESTESRARLSASRGERVVLRSDRIAHVRVAATIHGVTGYKDITYETLSGFVEEPVFRNGGNYYPDGKIEFVNLCTVYPDGRREYSPRLAERAKMLRAMPIPADSEGVRVRARMLAAAEACKL